MSTSSELLLERVRAATEDEYTIERELGRGGMAAVFLARDIALERRVAVKVMLPDLIDVEGISDRFVIEARTAAHLDHPGIVTVYSVKQRAGLLFIVMKYIEGRTLESVMKGEQGLDAAVITEIVSHVAEALHFAHAEGVIHRDVKPSNIIIDTKGRPVVTDFGIAKIGSGKSITVTGSMIGTPAYMSPEQCRGLPATAASDQYALGVMMYEMLTRHLPFEGTIFELINAHCNESPPPLAERVPGIDPELEETVTRMLAKNPRERWPALTDVAKRLTGAHAPRRTSEVRATIAALARGEEATGQAPRRLAVGFDLSGAATELATTPAPQLVVTPPDPAIEIGETVQLRVSESSGASLGGFKIRWKSEDPTIATVDDTGIVTGRSVGFAKITVSGGAAFGRVAITVRAPSVDTLVVTPQSPELVAENEMQFVATVLDARGTTLTGQAIVWQSSDVSVCAVSGQGRAIGIAPGKATITAICGEVRGTAQVKVRLPGVERIVIEPGEVNIEADETRRLSATVFGAAQRKLTGRTLTWRSTVPTVVTVEADGTIKGVAPGTAAVIAATEGKEGLVSVSVRSQPIVAVRIQPERLQLEAGRSLQLKGIGEDRRGRAVTEKGIEWRSDDDQIALVDASGKVHAVREGRTHVRAVAGDATSSIEVTVVPREAAQIRIDAHPPSLAVGEFVSLDAAVLDADGATLHGRAVTWKSDNDKVITVGANGVCEAKKPGSVRVTAVCERARATTKLNVTAAARVGAAAAVPVVERDAAPTKDVASTPPSRRKNRVVPIGAVLVALTAIGVWAATGPHGGASTGATTAPTTAPANTNTTSVGMPVQRPADPVSNPANATKAPANATKAPTTGNPAGTTSRGGASPPVTTTPPARRDSVVVTPPLARRDSVVVTPPPARRDSVVITPPPVRRDSVVTPPPAGNRATDPNAAARAALCTSGETPRNLLTSALGPDPVAAINKLVTNPADAKAKQVLVNDIKESTRLRSTVTTIRSVPVGESCEWVMTIDFEWVNFVRASKHRTAQLNLTLELVVGAPQIKSVSALSSQ